MLQDFSEVVQTVEALYEQPNVEHPGLSELRARAEQHGIRTRFGNYAWLTSVRSRSAPYTLILGKPEVRQRELGPLQRGLLRQLPQTLRAVHAYMKKAPFVCIERQMGDNREFTPRCRLFVSVQRKDCVRIPYMWSLTNFDPPASAAPPDMVLVAIPEWQDKDRQMLVFPELSIAYVLGSDYHGEVKKGFLRMGMWQAKQRDMLGLHAGTKILKARDVGGKLYRYGMLIFGLSATGKTTHTCHHHGLTGGGEGVEIIQDDIVLWKPDGSALGTERGFFLKTDGINPDTQPLLYRAATCPQAVFENVMVDHRGNVDFLDETLTANGRGVVQWSDLEGFKAESINLPPVDELDGLIIAFITRRNTILPICSKLTVEQAAAAFMLGESVESSAGDPRRVGESVRVVGTNPFIVGDRAEEGNRFYEIARSLGDKVSCYLLNTGGVGELSSRNEDGEVCISQPVTRVEIPEMAAIIRAIARNRISWRRHEDWGTLVPAEVPGVDMSRFDPSRYYTEEQLDKLAEELKRERVEHMRQFPNLKEEIVEACV